MSEDDLDSDVGPADMGSADLTYDEVGATRAALVGPAGPDRALPAGYRHLLVTGRLPDGTDLGRVGRRLLAWQVHRDAGARLRTAAPVAPGTTVTSRLGPPGPFGVTAPCRVVWVVQEPDLVAFGYGTLPGHPFAGEEAFAVRREADGSVAFVVVAFSQPARWWSALAGPLVPQLQHRYARGLVRSAAGSP